MGTADPRTWESLPKDRWRSATYGFIQEIVAADVVAFTALVDAAALQGLRERCARAGLDKPSWTALVVKAISVALRRHPQLNRLILRGLYRFRPVQLADVDAVVAAERVRDGEDTVYAQVLRQTDRKPVWNLSEELRQTSLVEEEQDKRLRLFMNIIRRLPGPLARALLTAPRWSPTQWVKHRGGAFALTTVGKYGVESIFVKWPWPLSFTFGEVKERPMVVDGEVRPRLSFYLSLAWNRELTNGAPAARFFNDIVSYLVNAEVTEEEQRVLGAAGTQGAGPAERQTP